MKTVKADDRRRVSIPDAKPGQVFYYRAFRSGVVLRPLKVDSRGLSHAKADKNAPDERTEKSIEKGTAKSGQPAK